MHKYDYLIRRDTDTIQHYKRSIMFNDTKGFHDVVWSCHDKIRDDS